MKKRNSITTDHDVVLQIQCGILPCYPISRCGAHRLKNSRCRHLQRRRSERCILRQFHRLKFMWHTVLQSYV